MTNKDLTEKLTEEIIDKITNSALKKYEKMSELDEFYKILVPIERKVLENYKNLSKEQISKIIDAIQISKSCVEDIRTKLYYEQRGD
ncbi:MAG: hypothetical protein KC516_02935 [Nanoarchaeota archaeon]|nr:hypothetical protein [Nanoarchaeota archaeon]